MALQPRERGVADRAPRPVRDPRERDGVVRVVDRLQVRDDVLDLGALVEAGPAEDDVRDPLPDEDVLEHARLRVRPVEDRDLVAVDALLDEACDPGRDVPRLGVLVLDLDHAHGLAVAELRPEVLLLALAVVRDDAVRGAEDVVRGAVVLLQRDRPRAGEVALELEHVADVGAPEGVDGLVGVADRAHVPVLLGEELQEPVLRVVRVLVLVDEDVAERLLPALARLGEALEDLDREVEHVVEVDRVRGVQPLLVALVHLRDGLVVERRDARAVLVRADELVLRVRDLRVDAARDEPLRVEALVLEDPLHEPHLVGLVVDREVRAQPDPLGLAAEHAAARGVEGEDPDPARGVAEEPLEPVAHLPRRAVRERDREDLVRLHARRGEQVGDAVGQDAGLARARAGDDEQRPLRVEDGLALGRVQVGEVGLGLGDGHQPMLASDPAQLGVDPGRGRRQLLLVARLEHDLDGRERRLEARVRADADPRPALAGLGEQRGDLALARLQAPPPRGDRRGAAEVVLDRTRTSRASRTGGPGGRGRSRSRTPAHRRAGSRAGGCRAAGAPTSPRTPGRA